MKKLLILLTILLVSSSFGQINVHDFSPEFVVSKNIKEAKEEWVTYDEDGKLRSSTVVSKICFRKDGLKKYKINLSLSMLETEDSLVYVYDSQKRLISTIKHVKVNPRNFNPRAPRRT